MKFNGNVLWRYMSMSPLALAFERYLECQIFERLPFDAPILDIGCGDGLFAYILFSEKIDTGVDMNLGELARARELGAYVELIHAKGESIPKPDGFYQTIMSNSVLEHIPDLGPVFGEIHRLLAPDGRLYLTVPTPDFEHNTVINQLLTSLGFHALAAQYRRFCSRFIWKQCHYHTLAGWKKLASRYGFECVQSNTYNPRSTCLINDFLYPFGILGLINKKLFHRWVLFPSLRRLLIYPFYLLVRTIFDRNASGIKDGLVFLALKKVTA
jgi:SAM-dependent methyltransferase